MDFRKTFLLALCCVGVVSLAHAVDDGIGIELNVERASAPVGWIHYFVSGAARLHANAWNFAQRYAEHQDRERMQALTDAQNVADAGSQVTRSVVNGAAQDARSAARFTSERASQASNVVAQRASQVAHSAVERVSQVGAPAAQRTSQFLQSPASPPALVLGGALTGYPSIVAIGFMQIFYQLTEQGGRTAGRVNLAAGRVRDLVDRAANAAGPVGQAAGNVVDRVGNAAERVGNAAGPVGQAAGNVVDRFGNAVERVENAAVPVVQAAGEAAERVGNAAGPVGQAAGNVVDRVGNAVERVENAAVPVAQAAGEAAERARNAAEPVRNAARQVGNTAGQASNSIVTTSASMTSIGFGALLMYKGVKDLQKGKKRSVATFTVGCGMVAAPFVAPTILEWLKSKQAPRENEEAAPQEKGAGLE